MKGSHLLRFLSILVVLSFVLTANIAPASSASDNGKSRVWVEFNPGSAGLVERSLHAAGAEFHYRFDDLNAFVVSLPTQAIQGIQHNPNVLLIEEDALRKPMEQETPYGVDMIQARQIWDADLNGIIDAGAPTGSNRTVCVIDSGVYTAHEDFAGINFTGGYPSNWNTDTCGHGSHVVGTIAAANNNVGVVGVTPGTTNLYIVKVFGDNCAWTYSSTLVDAANRCEAAGADVISMSLGGTTKSKLEDRAFATLYSKGVLSIAAAGNDGNTAISYPAGYTSVVSVAAIDENKVVADFSQQNSDVEIAAPGVAVLSTVPYLDVNTLTVGGTTYNGNYIEYAARGLTNGALVDGGLCTAAGAWSGNVVLCQRGDISFYDKVHNAELGGAAAAVIYNNVPGNFLGTLGEGYTSSIPAISLSQEDGQALIATKLGLNAVVDSHITWNVSAYAYYDGTSMATPHVSAAAALVWSAMPELTNAQIREALNLTAQDLGVAGRDVAYGYGLVQAYNAFQYIEDTYGGGSGGTITATIATNKSSYVNRETVTFTVTAKDEAGAPVSNAAVSVSLLTANGKTVTLNGTTDTNGVSILTWKVVSKTYGVGTYTATATVSKDGYTSGTAVTTFLVTK